MLYGRQHSPVLLLLSLLLLLFLLFCVRPCGSVYFYLREGEERCFLEDMAEGILVVGFYRSPDGGREVPPAYSFQSTLPTMGVHITVRGPRGNTLLHTSAEEEGTFAVTAQEGGVHRVCLSTNTTRVLGPPRRLRFHLDLTVGALSANYAAEVEKGQRSEIELVLLQSADKVDQIIAEQAYQHEREESFRNTSESNNRRVMWWSITQIAVLVVLGVWQVWHIHRLFIDTHLLPPN